jgi:muramoyltetrapeptide carboxypeptidase
MLDQLKMAGVLARQRAIVFGQFTGIRPVPGYDRGFGLNTVIDRLRASLKVPVLAGLPFGHVQTKVLLPVGAKVSMAAEGRDIFLVWGHRHAHGHDDHHGHDHHHAH